jgi:cell division protein ZapA (FtsZ GTPase activity inhibitor)
VKRTITLEIAGTKFRLVSDAEQDELSGLADMINARVDKLTRGGGAKSASSSQLLALVALELADELQTERRKLAQVEALTRSAITQAMTRIDARLAADAPGRRRES